MVFPYTSQVEKWIKRLLFSEQYLTFLNQKQNPHQHQINVNKSHQP